MQINLKNVSKTIHKAEIIQHTDLVLESGTIIGFQGVNGSGKTMLLRLICGLIRPSTGEIWIDGKQLWKDLSFPESIGILIESPAFLPHYSAVENLKLLGAIKGIVNIPAISKAISRVGLNPEDKKKYSKFSLGMKQRLGIAGAIFESPDIVILDEPTNALDVNAIEMVKQILREEKARGALVLMACHDLPLLEEMSDSIYTVEEGKLRNRGRGTKREVLA